MESLSPQTQQPIPTKVPPTVESSVIKNGLSWKFSILSGIVVLIVIILGSGAYLSHSVDTYDECIQYYPVIQSFPPHCVNARGEYFFEPDDPLLWKTYSNQEYGFELQYPPFLVLNNNFSDIVSNSENGYNFLVCLDEPNELPETICLDTIEKSFLDDEIKRASGDVKDIPIGDKKYLNYKFSGYYGGSDKYAIPLNDSNYLVISKRWSEGSTPRSFDLDYLLSTLKFTNTVVDTSGWKTYRSDKFAIEFEIPQSWVEDYTPSFFDGKKTYEEYGGVAFRVATESAGPDDNLLFEFFFGPHSPEEESGDREMEIKTINGKIYSRIKFWNGCHSYYYQVNETTPYYSFSTCRTADLSLFERVLGTVKINRVLSPEKPVYSGEPQ